MCILNLHEEERSKPCAWIPVGWLPVYDESRDTRPCYGLEGSRARKMQLYHQAWTEFLDKWAEKTKHAVPLFWADGECRMIRFFQGGGLGDQQEGDEYSTEPCTCHRCKVPSHNTFLQTNDFQMKRMDLHRKKFNKSQKGKRVNGLFGGILMGEMCDQVQDSR